MLILTSVPTTNVSPIRIHVLDGFLRIVGPFSQDSRFHGESRPTGERIPRDCGLGQVSEKPRCRYARVALLHVPDDLGRSDRVEICRDFG